jgi:hypothetical protein
MDKTVSDLFPVLEAQAPDIVDLRQLEAPGPMEQVLLATSQLGKGEFFLARVPKVPTLLFPHLESRSLSWWVHEEVDQSAIILIRKDA